MREMPTNGTFSTLTGWVETGGERGDKTFSTTTPYRVGGGGGGGSPQGGGGDSRIAPADTWGPFARDLDPTERLARCRCLRAIVHLSTGRRGDELAEHLLQAERDPDALPLAIAALNRLAGLDHRHVLASYAALNRPAA